MWQYSESYHHRKPEPAPEQVKAPVSRRRVIDLDGLSDVWWRPRPAVAQRVAVAEPALSGAAERERAIGRRVRRIEGLIDRVGRLDVVRGDADLVEELENLDVTDPAACLHTVDIVLAEALGRERAQTDPDLLDPWIRRLELSVAEAETIRHELVVAPAADGRIDGRVPKKKGAVEVRDSVAVMRGDHNRLEVSHLCVVEQPVIEIADLVALDGEQAVFDLWAWGFTPAPRRGPAPLRVRLGGGGGYLTEISSCQGVMVGDDNTMSVKQVYRMPSCPVNLVALLSDRSVRRDLALSRGGSPEHAAQAEAARRRLPETVRRAVNAIDVSRLVCEDDIAAQAAQAQRPSVSSGWGRIVVTHGLGVSIGVALEVSSRTDFQVGRFRIE